jgi:Cu+-exporting ATPase
VVFDKTGTLTSGQLEVTSIATEANSSEMDVLTFAAAVEAPSEHPIARAIVREAKSRGIKIPNVTSFRAVPGSGVSGEVMGQQIEVRQDPVASVQVRVDDKKIGTVTLADRLRPDARDAIDQLRGAGINVAMLSGDKLSTARLLGKELGLQEAEIVAEATPESKAKYVQAFQADVMMVGDGLNDSAALAASGLGVALATGTNVAIESAAVVIPGDRVRAVPELLHLSKLTLRTIHQNLFFAFLYNGLAIPLAAFGMLGTNGPLWAALAMGLSDITVIGNALRLKRRLENERRSTALESSQDSISV